jgi:phosphate-selective porin
MKRIAVVASLLVAFAALPAAAQGKKKDEPRGLVWNDRPSIVFGKHWNVELKGRALPEWRRFDPDIGQDIFRLRTARIGLKGELSKHFSWEAEREIAKANDRVELGDWKDVALEWHTFDKISIKGGRFKVPFGLEQTTGISDLDFAYRALGSTQIAPGRDRGAMAFGDLGRVNYEVGVFDDDGDNAQSNEPQFVEKGVDLNGVGPSVAARVSGNLFRLLPIRRLRSATVGVAYTTSDVPEGLNSLRAESVWGTKKFFDRVYVKGRRQRLGAQFDWTPGPVGVKAEWMQSREQRNGQSNRNEDLSDLIGTAWYVTGSWFVTGEDKGNNLKVKHPFLRGGVGAIELAVRYDELEFRSASTTGTAFTNPRADHLVPNADGVWTFGVNWTTSKWTRVQLNAIHEDFLDPKRTPDNGLTSFWSSLVRLNIVF